MDELEEELYGSTDHGVKPPLSTVEALIQRVGSRAVLDRLKSDESACSRVFRGFKVGAKALAHPLVQRRFVEELEDDGELRSALLTRWRLDCPDVCGEVESRSVDALRAELPSLCKRWGGGALWLTLAGDKRKTAVQLLRARGIDWNRPALEESGRAEETAVEEYSTPTATAPAPEPDDELTAEVAELRTENASLKKQVARERSAHARARNEARKWQQRCAAARAEATSLGRENSELIHRLQRLERQRDKLLAENDALQRQLRRLRKQLPEPASPEETPAEVVVEPRAPKPTRKPVPDRVPGLVWKEGTRRHSVPLSELIKAVYTNNTSLVQEWSESLRRLARQDRGRFEQLRDALAHESPYCAYVLTRNTPGVIVDGSNVCHYEHDDRGRAKLANLLSARRELQERRFFPILILVDASLPHQIDDPDGLEALMEQGAVQPVMSGTDADDEITRLARELGYYVVTNDRGLTSAIDPELELPVLTYSIEQDYFYCREG